MDHPLTVEPLVLVVDDDADAREMYGVVLGGAGFRVESAENGVEAINKARSLQPRLIVMDLSLPSMDGWEAGRHLKEEAATRHIPIVALSGTPIDTHGSGEQVFAAALMKPCFPDDMVAAVRRLVGAHHT
jgi:two-component system, cell cycle response regulator DivK